jgi:hypothetical protein
VIKMSLAVGAWLLWMTACQAVAEQQQLDADGAMQTTAATDISEKLETDARHRQYKNARCPGHFARLLS